MPLDGESSKDIRLKCTSVNCAADGRSGQQAKAPSWRWDRTAVSVMVSQSPDLRLCCPPLTVQGTVWMLSFARWIENEIKWAGIMQRGGGKGAGFIFFSCMERKRCKVKGTAYMGNITNKLYYLIDLGENIFVDIAHRTSKLGQKQDGFKSRAKVVYIFLQLYCLSFILGS